MMHSFLEMLFLGIDIAQGQQTLKFIATAQSLELRQSPRGGRSVSPSSWAATSPSPASSTAGDAAAAGAGRRGGTLLGLCRSTTGSGSIVESPGQRKSATTNATTAAMRTMAMMIGPFPPLREVKAPPLRKMGRHQLSSRESHRHTSIGEERVPDSLVPIKRQSPLVDGVQTPSRRPPLHCHGGIKDGSKCASFRMVRRPRRLELATMAKLGKQRAVRGAKGEGEALW